MESLFIYLFSINIARFLGCVDFKVWLIDEWKLGHKKSLICTLVRVSNSNSYWRSSLANNQQENFSKCTAAGMQLMSIRCPMEMGGGGEGHRIYYTPFFLQDSDQLKVYFPFPYPLWPASNDAQRINFKDKANENFYSCYNNCKHEPKTLLCIFITSQEPHYAWGLFISTYILGSIFPSKINQRGKNAWNESTTEQRKPRSVCPSPYFYYSLAWMVIWKGIYDVYTLSKTSCSSNKDSGPLKTFSLAGPSKWKAWKAGGQVVTILDINTHWHHTPKSRKNCQKQEITCTDSNHINNMTEIRIWKKTLKSQQVYFWHFHAFLFIPSN